LRTLLLLFLIPCSHAFGQAVHSLPSSPYTGMGAYSFHFTDVFSSLSNQAALANMQQASAGIYAERKFLLALTQGTGIVALPTQHGNIGIVLHYFGAEGYNESQVALALAKKLGRVDLGIRFNYTHIQVPAYGTDGAVSMELGTLWHISDQLHTGVQITNPLGGRFKRHAAEKLATVFRLGLGYEVTEKVLISTEIMKEENRPVNVLVGLQYHFMEKLFVRAGITTATTIPFMGVGLQWKNIRVDITANYHAQLGVTPGLMIVFGNEQ
jgi:hypothetical protein